MKMNLSNHAKLIIQYDGTEYLGWQIQPNRDKTIQGQIHIALEKILKTTEFKTIGAGRTDTGVHAIGQVAKVSYNGDMNAKNIQDALNGNLPEDIRVIDSSNSTFEFRPTNDAKSKEYHYYFSNDKIQNPLTNKYCSNITNELDFDLMQLACKCFKGEHSFDNYFCEGSNINSTTRTIYKCFIEDLGIETATNTQKYRLVISGNGFLKQMVRLVIGTIWQVGKGKASIDDVKESLNNPEYGKLAAVAPPNGLYKVKVEY